MFPRKPPSSLIRNFRGTEPAPCSTFPWIQLEQFVTEIELCENNADRVQLLLSSIRTLTPAEVAFFHPGRDSEQVFCAGEPHATSEACRNLTAVLLKARGNEGDRLLCDSLPTEAWGLPDVPMPRQVGLVCVSRTKNLWIGLLVFRKRQPLQADHLAAARSLARVMLQHRRTAQVTADLKASLFGTIQSFAAAIDAKDSYTYGHSERVGRMAVRLGETLGLDHATIADLYLAGLMHDIGKIGVPDEVLRKPGRLTEDEFRLIQAHTIIGDKIVSTIPRLARLRVGVRNHHERYDGMGYPDRLKGDDIPLLGRVLAVADTCDAMLSARTYRQPHTTAQLESTLLSGRGSQWDPSVIDAFMSCRQTLYSICQKGMGSSVAAVVSQMVDGAASNSSLGDAQNAGTEALAHTPDGEPD